MHEDLRRRALESRKTVSKKAQSKQSSTGSSRAGSAPNSRPVSRAASRQPSDEEDADGLSDGWGGSIASIDGILSGLEDEPLIGWDEELTNRIDSILDRKRSSIQAKEEDLAAYVHILRIHYAQDTISRRLTDLTASFLRSIRAETSEKEVITALKAIAMSTLTDPSATTYDQCASPLKTTITSSGSLPTKAEAIHTLSILTFYGGASIDETESTMDYFLEIIESDGESVSAPDDVTVVTAALDAWGFLATQVDDMSESSQETMEPLVEQLDSADPGVQVSAGENIALLYEKSYTDLESDEEVSDTDDNTPPGAKPTKAKRYDPYRSHAQLLHKLDALANVSSKHLSKKSRKSLHANFADIRQSVDNPLLGPRYSTALDAGTNAHYGSRLEVKVGQRTRVAINRWWKLLRLKALRRALQGGFLEHYERNEVVLETLPVLTS